MLLSAIRKELARCADKRQASLLQRFFKTGPGEYAEGDRFLGIKVPVVRSIAKKYCGLSLRDIRQLLRSPLHEERFLALIVLIAQFQKGDQTKKETIYKLYLRSTKHINNWDLVDVSAKHIVGAYLLDKDKSVLGELARSRDLWERRIAVLSAFHFIEKGLFDDTLRIAQELRDDPEDLIHKAVGWMLREVGKRDLAKEESFLKKYYRKMPRTMLRYAIEHFPESKRQAYLKS